MSLPLPNMGNPLTGLGTSLNVGRQGLRSVGQLVQKSTQAFGDLLSQMSTSPDNGQSEVSSLQTSSQSAPSDGLLNTEAEDGYAHRIQSLRTKLQSWLKATCKQLGIERDSQPLDVRLDTEQRLDVSGPEPLRTQLRDYIQSSEEISTELKELQKSQPSSLPWLPSSANQNFNEHASNRSASQVDPFLIQL